MRPILFYPAIIGGVLSSVISGATTCTQYTVQEKDTCRSITKASKVTYAQLLSWNPSLDVTCGNLSKQKDGKICISNPLGNFALPSSSKPVATLITTEAPVPSPTGQGTNAHCGEWYQVALGDDCSMIATNHSITRKDLLFLNPELFDNCTNLLADVYYCVQPVGYISTYPGYDGSSTRPPIKPVSATMLPNPDRPAKTNSSNIQIIPIANGTRLDCYKSDNQQDFILWNPSLASSKDTETFALTTASPVANPYAYPCTVSANSSYCVMLASPTPEPEQDFVPPSPLAAGTPANCTRYHQVQSYNTCENILAQFYLDIEQFYAMNPTIGKDCTGLAMGTYYCISIWANGRPSPVPEDEDDDDDDDDDGLTTSVVSSTNVASVTGTTASTPSPIQTGMVSNCNKFYNVQEGDGCWAISNNNNINLDDFYKWNPAVGKDCSTLQPKFYVCVGVQASGIPTPTPTQTGMVMGCKSFYKVQKGDGCWAIANNHKIKLDDFYKWNPAVKTDCSGLQPNYNVCVGV
ncbi:peptidoglycan-binding lysin domain protein [Fusarium tjaetaba]|uniref:Peptidoglycan-binding lysin domain protein n=1 Tax=Fusarium tjaetaba TaxID=1567544 RepID=A0A8H5R4G1_9HYPO|nr:peptidoglycan-binding lysin domain protein [Fusarium tjaetaba]KAF5626370.1 peptidoglycan-binding lysin domain protein [Fusarium tjaetaba]